MASESAALAADDRPRFPAYGPLNAALGYVLFYALVTRATPALVEVLGPILGPGLVRLGLAAALWFILIVTGIEQARRQLAALGVGRYRPTYWRALSPAVPSSRLLLAYLGILLLGGLVATRTVDRALGTAVDLVTIVGRLNVAALDPGAIIILVGFFVAYGSATWAADRLLIGGLRHVWSA